MDYLQKTDCLVIGAGPAGLTAAVYLGRYLRSVLVADHGRSWACLIPRSHNYPAFPQGATGEELLQRLRRQALRYGAVIFPEQIAAEDTRQAATATMASCFMRVLPG